MNVFRLPFRWERLQRSQLADFDAQELGRIDTFVGYATGKGAWVILDPHNYARYFGEGVGEGVPVEAYADFWSKLADHFKGNGLVAFGLMNEPHDMSTERWRDDANAAIAAIRGTGASNLILVPGNGWTGAWAWLEGYYGTANAEVMGTIDDPLDNFVFEVHQYLDTDGSGTSGDCVSSTIGVERLTAFTGWLEDNGFRAFLGEFAGGANATCTEALDGMLDYMDARPERWMGWAWWAAGPWWGDYMFSIEPSGGEDRPQMSLLEEHL
jgi:endoglucanase